ncbi:MAG TPA: hypothetical protein HA362_03395 [Nanoarchaeota archaeon]|nr:hypothetical protein [Nanoarchaeota archaeon]
MSLDEDIGPVCVEGIEEESAVDRARELGLLDFSYFDYRFGRVAPVLYFAATAYFTLGGPLWLCAAGAAVMLSATGFSNWMAGRRNRKAVRALEAYASGCEKLK